MCAVHAQDFDIYKYLSETGTGTCVLAPPPLFSYQPISTSNTWLSARVCASQGEPESGWMLLDFGDIIVHIMTPKSRQYYDLDSFWGNGTRVPLDGVLTPNAPPSKEPVSEEVVSTH